MDLLAPVPVEVERRSNGETLAWLATGDWDVRGKKKRHGIAKMMTLVAAHKKPLEQGVSTTDATGKTQSPYIILHHHP